MFLITGIKFLNSFLFRLVTQTSNATDPWWKVELGQPYIIREIVIFKRLDPYGDDLVDFNVFIYDDNGTVTSMHIKSIGVEPFISLKFNDIVGSSVKIQLNGADRILSLTEVQVYGSLKEFYVRVGQMIGKRKINQLAIMQYTEGSDINMEHQISEISSISITQGSLSPILVSFACILVH